MVSQVMATIPSFTEMDSIRGRGGDMTNRSALAFDIEQRDATFGSGIELEDLRNLEALLEVVPHFRSQPVAAGHPDAMISLIRR